MKIVVAYPPNFENIIKVFPKANRKGVIFAFGDTIYSPSTKDIAYPLIQHESAHGERQLEIGVDTWWEQYLSSKKFRLEEEVIAHRAEYKAYQSASRNDRRRALAMIAGKLASPLYGRMISEKEARKLIA